MQRHSVAASGRSGTARTLPTDVTNLSFRVLYCASPRIQLDQSASDPASATPVYS